MEQFQVSAVVRMFEVNILFMDIISFAYKSKFDVISISGIANFDKSRYLGSWYEFANVFEFYQIGSTCVRATYTDEGDRIGVFNEQVNAM